MDEDEAVLPSSSATSVRKKKGIVKTETSKGRGEKITLGLYCKHRLTGRDP